MSKRSFQGKTTTAFVETKKIWKKSFNTNNYNVKLFYFTT